VSAKSRRKPNKCRECGGNFMVTDGLCAFCDGLVFVTYSEDGACPICDAMHGAS